MFKTVILVSNLNMIYYIIQFNHTYPFVIKIIKTILTYFT